MARLCIVLPRVAVAFTHPALPARVLAYPRTVGISRAWDDMGVEARAAMEVLGHTRHTLEFELFRQLEVVIKRSVQRANDDPTCADAVRSRERFEASWRRTYPGRPLPTEASA